MKISRLIIIICILVISPLPGQNTTIFFLRDGSIVQGTVIDENQRRIFLKTDQGTLKILPENILGREDLAKQGDLTFMSERIDFLQRHVEHLTGKTQVWKDSLKTSVNDLFEIYRGVEVLQQEFEADLLRLNSRDKDKKKQLLEMAHDIVEHEVDLSANRQSLGMVRDTLTNIDGQLKLIEDNLAKNINQTYVLSGSVANTMDDLQTLDDRILNNKSQVDIMSGSVANLYREVQRVEGSFEFINKSLNENKGSIGLNQQSINANNSAISALNELMYDKINDIRDSLKVVQGELISTMELLWKKNKKSVSDFKDTFEDSLHSVERSITKVDQKVIDLNSDLDNHILKMQVAIDGLNKAITTINGNISGLQRNMNDVSSKLDVLSTKVSKIKKK